MKRSKIFLGITTCVLGIAAVAAAKARFSAINLFYTANGCTATTVVRYVTAIGGTNTSNAFKNGYRLYTNQDVDGNCVTPLYFTTLAKQHS